MRAPYVHEASLALGVDDDLRGPGGAITLALCGSWEHSPPCPLASHHTQPMRDGDTVTLRIVFATEPDLEDEVRRRIDSALRAGTSTGPDGELARWIFRGSTVGVLSESERAHALRMAGA